MEPKIFVTFLLVLCSGYVAGYIRVCYVTNWSQYRPGYGKYTMDMVPSTLCTHLIFAFAKVDMSSFHLTHYEWNDREKNYPQLQAHKKNNPELKTLLAVGGWNHASTGFTQMVKTKSGRQTFILQSVKFLQEYGFDGLDLDWEYPGIEDRGSVPADRELFTLLCKELKEEYSKHGLLITAAVSAGQDKIDKAYEVLKISEHLDFINLMSYDLHGAWDTSAGHHTDSDGTKPNMINGKYVYTVQNAMKYWLKSGMDPKKLILGLGTYGRTQKLNNPCNWELNSATSRGGVAGTYTREVGFLAYYEICKKTFSSRRCSTSSSVHAPYGSDGRDFIGYDDEESIIWKVNNIMKPNNLGGFMFWALDLDDFRGVCGNGVYPLIKAAKNAAMNQPTNYPQCNEIISPTCSAPTPVTVGPTGPGNNCRVNPDGSWAGNAGIDAWCKNPGNCPGSSCGTKGCTSCMCICDDDKVTTTTTTTTKRPTTKSTTTTTRPTSTSTTDTTRPTTKSTSTTTRPTTKTSSTTTTQPMMKCKTNPKGPWGNGNYDRWCQNYCPYRQFCGKPGCSNCYCICDDDSNPSTTTTTEYSTMSSSSTKPSTTSTTERPGPGGDCSVKTNNSRAERYCKEYCPSRCDVSWYIKKHCNC